MFTAGGMKALTVAATDNDLNHIDDRVGEIPDPCLLKHCSTCVRIHENVMRDVEISDIRVISLQAPDGRSGGSRPGSQRP